MLVEDTRQRGTRELYVTRHRRPCVCACIWQRMGRRTMSTARTRHVLRMEFQE